jgi:hypothetical protein
MNANPFPDMDAAKEHARKKSSEPDTDSLICTTLPKLGRTKIPPRHWAYGALVHE